MNTFSLALATAPNPAYGGSIPTSCFELLTATKAHLVSADPPDPQALVQVAGRQTCSKEIKMAKFVVIVDFAGGYPKATDITRTLQDLLGTPVQAVDNGDNTITVRIVSAVPHSHDSALIQFESETSSAFVETDAVPSHLEWATVAALERLGGNARQKVPAFATKRFSDTSFWERIQFKRRFWGG